MLSGVLGTLWGLLGGSWGHLVQSMFSAPKTMVRWTLLWATRADPKIDDKLYKSDLFFMFLGWQKQDLFVNAFFIRLLSSCRQLLNVVLVI